MAARLGIGSLSIDDLALAAQVVTTPETHPGLHVMRRAAHLEYFTDSTMQQLEDDATLHHEAIWPVIEGVVRRHAMFGPSIVIDGWHLTPHRVAQLKLNNVRSGWIVASPAVLEERERTNTHWMQDSRNPKRMLENFLARSLWFNDLIERQARELHMTILRQDGERSVGQLCDMLLQYSRS